MARIRADAALVEAGLFPSRERAHAAILAGDVRVGGEPLLKPGQQVDQDTVFEVAPGQQYVSRGGFKLAAALDAFGIDPEGMRVLDVGASTGGFTDCLLQRGAAAVTALDVGYGQLAWSLRTDPRVTVLERTNIRSVEGPLPGAAFDLAVIDVSFIALVKVLPFVREQLGETGQVVALVKPQFEAGKGRVGKRGVVRDPEVHADVLRTVARAAEEMGWVVRGVTFSPVKGPEGNIEFLIWLAGDGEPSDFTPEATVAAAREALGGG
jgi:23S rRNA (cytidine1920-2'-O)/16S rRNA (cytidine1409-2'-O)-methyltransferase